MREPNPPPSADPVGSPPNTDPALRRKADAAYRARMAALPDPFETSWPETARSLVHELRVHQIELEMQNEELRRTQVELAVTRARYFDLFDLAPVGYLIVRESGLILQANLTAAAMLGEVRGALIDRPVSRSIFKDDQDVYYLCRKRLVGTGEAQSCELQMVKADGTVLWVRVAMSAVRADDGPPLHRVTLTDIGENKRAERELLQSNERFELVIAGTPDGFWDWDFNTDNAFYSPRFKEMLGYADTDPRFPNVFESFRERLHPQDLAATEEAIRRTVEGGVPYRAVHRLRTATGEWLWVEARGATVSDPKGRTTRMAGSISDLTARRRSEAALRDSEILQRSILDSLPAHIAVVDRDGVIVAVNDQWRRFGSENTPEPGRATRRDVGDNYLSSSLGAGPEFEECARAADAGVRAVLDGRVPEFHLEYPCHSPAARRWFALSVTPLGSAGAGAVVAHHNVTRHKLLEEQLRQAQKLEAIGLLAGGVAHDFNNLLTIINGHAEMLLDAAPAADPRRELSAIRHAGERAAELTAQLLAFGRKALVAPKVLDLNQVVEKVARMLRRLIGENVRLVTEFAPGTAPVKIDPGQIEQVLMNLAVNARDAMPRGGTLMIATVAVHIPAGAPDPDGAPPGHYVQLTVSDTGEGMSEEVRGHVFEPFFTTKGLGRGTGLGLATVHGIVHQAGGTISVTSEIGRGTQFRIRFPAAEEFTAAPRSGEFRGAAPRGTETVLVAEDEDAVRGLVRLTLESHGYTVLEGDCGATAARVAAAHPGPIHLLLSDVVMPDFGGRELVDALRAARPGVAVLFTSGYTDDCVVRNGVAAESDAFLQKPFTPLSLLQKVRAVLDTTRTTRAEEGGGSGVANGPTAPSNSPR